MRRLVLKMSMSLDGFVAGPNEEIDWIFRNRDDGATVWTAETLERAGLHAMGSRTFRDMAAYWPTSTGPFAALMNEIPKVVFTRQPSLDLSAGQTTTALEDAKRADAAEGIPDAAVSPAGATWAETEVVNGDLMTEIGRLKAQDGRDVLAHGGAGFARSLVRLGLVDEYRLLIHPVALGRGLPLFSELSGPADLKLIETSVFASGAAAHVYQPA